MRYRVIPVSAQSYSNALVRDISMTGFKFHTQEFIPHRSSFLLEMHLPGSSPLRSLARAAWVRAMPEEDGYEIGGMFIEPPRLTQSALTTYLASEDGQQRAFAP